MGLVSTLNTSTVVGTGSAEFSTSRLLGKASWLGGRGKSRYRWTMQSRDLAVEGIESAERASPNQAAFEDWLRCT